MTINPAARTPTPRQPGDVPRHMPARPSWRCTGCPRDWPCTEAKRYLRRQYGESRVSLTLYLADCLIQACEELPDQPAGELAARILGWARRREEVSVIAPL